MCEEDNRRSSKTTRQVDELIQLLFSNPTEWHLVEDESFKCSNNNYRLNEYLLDKINRRMMEEHKFMPKNRFIDNKRYVSLHAK